jgi:catechol 2,3-dioxygenase-like lactoylglutathione lyase family enzyme
MLRSEHAYTGFAVTDIQAARDFYGRILGLQVTDTGNGLLRLHLSVAHSVLIYPKADHTPADFTILNFPVDDIDATVDELAEQGLSFQRYPGVSTDERGIHRGDGPAIAWFTDPSGNILSIIQE